MDIPDSSPTMAEQEGPAGLGLTPNLIWLIRCLCRQQELWCALEGAGQGCAGFWGVLGQGLAERKQSPPVLPGFLSLSWGGRHIQ